MAWKKLTPVFLISLVKLFINFPIGVTSKKRLTGAFVALARSSACNLADILPPSQQKKTHLISIIAAAPAFRTR
jgi:hypothetical protein